MTRREALHHVDRCACEPIHDTRGQVEISVHCENQRYATTIHHGRIGCFKEGQVDVHNVVCL